MLPSLVHEPQRVAAEDSRQRRIFRPLICRKCARRAPNQAPARVAARPGRRRGCGPGRRWRAGPATACRRPRGVGVARERSLAAVAAHADDDAPAQIRQLAAGLPARVRHGQLPLAGVPFAQLVQDPAGFLAHRVVDLAQRDQLGAVTRRPSSVMTKPMLRRRERSSTKPMGCSSVFTSRQRAPGGSGSGQGVGTRAEAFGDSVSSGSPEWAGTDPADAPGTARQARARSGRRARRGVRRRHAFRRAGFPRVEQEFELSAARHTFQG